MTDFTIDEKNAIATFKPKGALSEAYFQEAGQKADAFIAENGDLTGLIIMTPHFPGWENLGSMISHFRFVKDHHKHIKKVAFVTDSTLLELVPTLTGHFVSAQVKTFGLDEEDRARSWILESCP